MKKTIFLICIIFSFSIYTISCKKFLIGKNVPYKPSVCFNQLWETMNDKYVFFDYKQINWDSIKAVYQPQINDNMSEQQLFTVLANVLSSLKDGHTSLYTPKDTFKYYYANGYFENYDKTFVKEKYLIPNNFKTIETIDYCELKENVGYMNYPSFKNELTQKGLDAILNSFSNTKGIIIDIRNNTGGDNTNILRLLEHFVSSKTNLGFSIEKKDANKNSFTKPITIEVSPRGIYYSKPIMVLTNRTVFSSANIFTGFISQFSNVKIIGDITWGGTGVPTSNDLPNGWRFRYSSSIVKLANGSDFENGLVPTISVSTNNTSQTLTGKDAIIERALLEIK